MAKKANQSSSITRRNEGLRPHRRPRVSTGRVVSYMFSALGDKLYLLGARIERTRRNIFRRLRKGFAQVAAFSSRMLRAGWGAVAAWFGGMWHDVSAPFIKMRRSFKSLGTVMRSTKGRGAKYRRERVRLFFRYGWMWNKHLVGRLLNYLTPLVALVTCVVVVLTVANLNFALRVTYNGQTVGYIENESVYESARKIIQGRIIPGDDDASVWDSDTELSITIIGRGQLSSQDVMADALLEASDDIESASGLYIGGMFYGATTAPDILQDFLDSLIAPYQSIAAELGADAVAKFAREPQLVPGIYPQSSVLPIDDLIAAVGSSEPQNIYYNAKVGDSVGDIARLNGISTTRLQELNPGLVLDFSQSGATLLVAENETLLRVKTVRTITYTERVAYETTTTRDSTLPIHAYIITQEGRDGEKTVTKEIEYDVSGNVINETIVSDVVTTPAVDQHVMVGTQKDGTSYGNAILAWPTGNGYTISRGWNATGASPHYGIDIAAALGTPIYAAEDGQVILALYTAQSYGHYIIIRHSGGLETLYAHCSTLLVEQGQYVERGQIIALMGSTGNSTGSHLHFEVRINGTRVPPEDWIY